MAIRKGNILRVRLISFGIIVVSFVFVSKLYLIQVVNGSSYKDKADRQHVSPSSVVYDRGSIFFEDKNGRLTTAANLQVGYTLALNPKAVSDKNFTYSKLSSVVDLDKNIFLTKASKKDDPYEELLKKLTEEQAQAIESLDLPGIVIQKEKWRTYPTGKIASRVVGFVGYKGDVFSGRYGLENYYEDILKRNNENIYSNFFVELFSETKDKIIDKKNLEGDIITSIEPSVAMYFDSELEKINSRWSSSNSGGIIIDPKTGEIYAMSVVPTFDPNDLQNEKDPTIFSNPLVENVYEMGSIIKPITMASGIDSGVVTANTSYEDKGFLILNGSKISNFDGKGRGVVDMQEVLNKSLNTGVAYVANKMGKEKFSEYMLSFGIGEETGIDLPNETHGLVSNLNSGRDIEHATASFGQGIAMTPIETVRALSALANGGTLITPHVVKRVDYKIGLSKKVPIDSGKRVIKKETSEEISRMLVNVYDTALLDGIYKMKNFSIAAKTGTAQIANPKGGGYYSDRYLHSFFGYFPAYDPKFLVFMYTYHPKGVTYASHTLTEPFVNVAKFLINYYNIAPDR